jgi:hypothetical protein
MITFETEDRRTSLAHSNSLFGVSGECIIVARRADGIHAVDFRLRRLNSFRIIRDAYSPATGRHIL